MKNLHQLKLEMDQPEMEMEDSLLMLICLIRWLVAYYFVGLLNVSVCDCVEHFSSLAYVY